MESCAIRNSDLKIKNRKFSESETENENKKENRYGFQKGF